MQYSLCQIEYALRYKPGDKVKILVQRKNREEEWIKCRVVQDTGHLVILSTGRYNITVDKRDMWYGLSTEIPF